MVIGIKPVASVSSTAELILILANPMNREAY